MTPSELREREMALTAQLIRDRLPHHPRLQPLVSAGAPPALGCDDSAIWLTAADVVLIRFEWNRWWDPRLSTREDHSARVAHQLAAAAAASPEAENILAQAHGRGLGTWYQPSHFSWNPDPPFERCGACWEWKRFPLAQRHLGWGWWRLCERSCGCGCHDAERTGGWVRTR